MQFRQCRMVEPYGYPLARELIGLPYVAVSPFALLTRALESNPKMRKSFSSRSSAQSPLRVQDSVSGSAKVSHRNTTETLHFGATAMKLGRSRPSVSFCRATGYSILVLLLAAISRRRRTSCSQTAAALQCSTFSIGFTSANKGLCRSLNGGALWLAHQTYSLQNACEPPSGDPSQSLHHPRQFPVRTFAYYFPAIPI